jgi:hypothetical protein
MPIADLLRTPLIALPLRNVSFGIYSLGSAVSLTGMWMERIAVGWLTWQLTESGFWLGVVAFADFFPGDPDRADRRRRLPTAGTAARRQDQPVRPAAAGDGAVRSDRQRPRHRRLIVALMTSTASWSRSTSRRDSPRSLTRAAGDLGAAVGDQFGDIQPRAHFVGPIFAGLAILWSGRRRRAFAAKRAELCGVHGGARARPHCLPARPEPAAHPAAF